MRRTIQASLLLVFAVLFRAEAQNTQIDFANPEIPAMKANSRIKVEDGILKINNGGTAVFHIGSANPLRITFRTKVVKVMESKNAPCWIFNLYGMDTEDGLFRWRKDNVLESYFYKNKQRKGGIITKVAFIDGKWFNVEIILLKNLVSVKLDGTEVANGKHPGFLPLKEFSFSAFNMDWELDDLAVAEIPQEKQQTVENPTFSLDFNGTSFAVNDKGEKISPLKEGAPRFVPGIDGKGISLAKGGKETLSYPLTNPFNSKVGGILFWVKSDPKDGTPIFRMTDGKNEKISAHLLGNKRIIINVARSDTKQGLGYNRSFPGELGDWVLVALTWDEESNSKFFINSLPYTVCFNPGQRMPDFLNADVNGITRLEIPGGKGDWALDRVRLFHRPLKNSDVYDEYRRFMPFDMVMERTIVPAGSPVKLSVQVAPGGYYTRPMPVEKSELSKGKGEFQFRLLDKDGKVLLDEKKSALVDKPLDLVLKDVTLGTGNYRLECTVNNAYRRTFRIDSFTSDYKAAVSKDDIRTGKLLYSKKLDNPNDPALLHQGTTHLSPDKSYLEAGNDKTDRFCFEIPFRPEQLGKPVVLDITWPDDKMRIMGWYMYPYGFGANRDRLQSGVSSGNEIPNSGKMQTTRHIFYPGTSKYLFEARTLAAGMPAAVAEVKVYEIEGGLPALKIHRPANMPCRKFGFYDEDQTFTNNLNVDVMNRKSPAYPEFSRKYPSETAFFTDEIMHYFDYTGMNSLHSPLWRYSISYFPVEGQTGNGMFPGGGGALGYAFDAFAQHGKKFIAIMNYSNLPDLLQLDKIESDYRKEGLETLDKFGDGIPQYSAGIHRANICHPKVLALFASYFEDPVKRYGNSPGFDGIEYWLNHFGNWGSLDYGYDDYTVRKFSRETGIKVPEKLKDRYAFLTGEKRKEWLKWRSEQVTHVVQMVRDILNKYNPALKLYLGVSQTPDNYEQYGIDLKSIKKIPNVAISVVRSPTAYRHAFHWGKPETTDNEELYNLADKDIQNYLMDGAAGVVISANTYFETFVHPLNKDYVCYFENADIKPHGRFCLREPAFAIGAFDALEYVSGGQPLGSIGRDAETREFAQAYGALPAKKFNLVPGITDPAVARFLQTPEGTYFYVVNLFHDDVTVRIDFSRNLPYIDLSTDQKLSGGTIVLKPFQLRSFLFPNEKVELKKLEFVSVGKETVPFYRKRIAALKAAADMLEKGKVDVAEERKDIALLEKAFAENRFAEVTRLAFCRRMNQLLIKEKNIALLIRQQKMMDQGHYAVNCGSSSFYTAPDGRFFFPDQAFNGKYGYFGTYNSITRETKGLHGTDLPELFKTEAYSLHGYKFKLPNGIYKIIFHMKAGFNPNYKPGVYRFTVSANGKPILNSIDLHEASGGDFNKALKFTAGGIPVTNGELVLNYRINPDERDKTKNTTVCLANGIEIIKEK